MHPSRRRPLVLLAALLALAPAAAAQEETPESVAAAYVRTMQAGEWEANARLMHPEATGAIRTLFTRFAATPAGKSDPQGMRRLLGVSNAQQLEALSGEQMYIRLMRNLVSQQGLGEMLRGSRTEIIGAVREAGTDNAYVVHRVTTTVAGTSITQTQVMPLKRHEGGWRVMLTANLEQIVSSLDRMMAP